MSVGTQPTKGERMAMEMAQQLGGVAVKSGTGGMTLVSKAEAERRKLIDKAKADLAETDKAALDQIFDKPVQPGAKRPSASARVKASKATREMDTAGTITDATPAEPVKVKAPYNPQPLSGAAPEGKQPAKGQLPAGLIAYLARKNAGSKIIAAAAGAPAQKLATKAQAGRKGAKR